jgi:predicted AlkP superfamily pyrophosphatase or phosphodiesterase
MPEPVAGADQVVLLVLDGLGWDQLQDRRHLAPTLSSMLGGPITSVSPSTTATALTSIATGLTPGVHGVMGYRVAVDHEVLNILRWSTPQGDARKPMPHDDMSDLITN